MALVAQRRNRLAAVAALGCGVVSLTLVAAESEKHLTCHGTQKEFEACDLGKCAEDVCVDCQFGEWSDYGPCTCQGLKERHRSVVTPNNGCGKPCEGRLQVR